MPPLGEALAIIGAAVLVIGILISVSSGQGSGDDGEPATMDVQNHLGDPNDPTAGAH